MFESFKSNFCVPARNQECIYVYIYIGILYFFNTLANMSAPAPSSSSPSYQTLPLSHIHRVTLSLAEVAKRTVPFFFSFPKTQRIVQSLSVFLSSEISLSTLSVLFFSLIHSHFLSLSRSLSPPRTFFHSLPQALARSSPCAHTPPQTQSPQHLTRACVPAITRIQAHGKPHRMPRDTALPVDHGLIRLIRSSIISKE